MQGLFKVEFKGIPRCQDRYDVKIKIAQSKDEARILILRLQ